MLSQVEHSSIVVMELTFWSLASLIVASNSVLDVTECVLISNVGFDLGGVRIVRVSVAARTVPMTNVLTRPRALCVQLRLRPVARGSGLSKVSEHKAAAISTCGSNDGTADFGFGFGGLGSGGGIWSLALSALAALSPAASGAAGNKYVRTNLRLLVGLTQSDASEVGACGEGACGAVFVPVSPGASGPVAVGAPVLALPCGPFLALFGVPGSTTLTLFALARGWGAVGFTMSQCPLPQLIKMALTSIVPPFMQSNVVVKEVSSFGFKGTSM